VFAFPNAEKARRKVILLKLRVLIIMIVLFFPAFSPAAEKTTS